MKKYYTIIIIIFISLVCSAQWLQTNGPYDGEVYSLDAFGTNIFAGTYPDGVFISTNNGTSWTSANTGLKVQRGHLL